MTLKLTALASLLALGLTACGGGGGGGGASDTNANAPGTTVATAPSNTGSVTANFVAGTTPARVLLSPGSESMGSVGDATLVQASSGAITTLDTYALTGSPTATKEIAGDASFAMGRWVWGTVTKAGATTDTLNGAVANNFWQYLVYNRLSALPTSASMTCNTGSFTAPVRSSSAGTSYTATSTGSATLTFSGGVATAGITITTTADSLNNTMSYSNVAINTPTTMTLKGGFPGTGAWISLADGGNGAVRIVGYYNTTLPNNATYKGVYTFLCS